MQRRRFQPGVLRVSRRSRARSPRSAAGVPRPTTSATVTVPSSRSPPPTGWAPSPNIAGSGNTPQRRSRCRCRARSHWPAASTAATVYADRTAVTEALIPIVNAELRALVAAGVDFIQLDEPSFACHPKRPESFLDVIARTVDGRERLHQHAHVLRKLPRSGRGPPLVPAAVSASRPAPR